MIRKFTSSSLSAADLSVEESLFHQANGRLGIRAYFGEYPENFYPGETIAKSVRGSYLNGFYENVPLRYAEAHKGFPMQGERMVTLPDPKFFRLEANGSLIHPLIDGVTEYSRELDPNSGLATRSYLAPAGEKNLLRVEVGEMVSFVQKELFAQELRFRSHSGKIKLRLTMGYSLNVQNDSGGDDPRVGGTSEPLLQDVKSIAQDKQLILSASTRSSALHLGSAMQISYSATDGANVIHEELVNKGDATYMIYHMELEEGSCLTFLRTVAYTDSRHGEDPVSMASSIACAANDAGWEHLSLDQRLFMDAFWQDKNLQIQGDSATQEAVHFALYSLLQSAADDGITLIPAKGLSGEGYEGHYFWDYEIYLYPFYLWTWPERARKHLDYRYSILSQARENAKILGYERGAQYAWRTITGPECSGYYPSGSAQLHINADIAYAFDQYWKVTGDLRYMAERGIDVLVETARTWIEVGAWHKGRFMIFGVTGPDEYTCLVDNNYYTNRSAQANLMAASDMAEELKSKGYTDFMRRLDLSEEELRIFRETAQAVYLPYDDELEIDAQDDGFLKLPVWDLAATPREQFPLLLHYHPSKLYRYQVLKQPDTTLAHFLYEEVPDSDKVNRSRLYYEKLTSHDSSLSPCIYGTMSALAGEMEKAKEYFDLTRDIDLKNRQGNTADGLHLGNLGGIWLFMVQGYAGLRLREGMLTFSPNLPPEWKKLRFPLRYRGARLLVEMRQGGALIELRGNQRFELQIYGRKITLQPGTNFVPRFQAVIFDLDGVLCHTDRFHYLAWKEVADREGIEFNETINMRLRGVSRMDSLDIILEKADKTYSDADKQKMAEEKNTRYRELLGQLSTADLSPVITETLSRLRDKGVRLAIGSSSKNARYILERLELTPYFEAISDGVGLVRSKPDPEVFLKATSMLELPPSECLVVEDAEAGLEAAINGGFTAAGFGTAADSELADFHWYDFDELARDLLP